LKQTLSLVSSDFHVPTFFVDQLIDFFFTFESSIYFALENIELQIDGLTLDGDAAAGNPF